MVAEHDGQHGMQGPQAGDWQDAEHIRRFAETIDVRAPGREPLFRLMAALIPQPPEARIRVLDLGTGLGSAAGAMLAAFPNAEAVGLDISAEMLRRAAERMTAFGMRFRPVVGDLSGGLPASVEGEFDAIISSIAIHHLPAEQKPTLYAACFPRLAPGGVLLNLDYVQPPDEYLIERYQAVREKEDTAQGLEAVDGIGAPPRHFSGGRLEEHLAWLRAAGFASVDCFAKQLNLALVGGFRR